VQTGRLNVVFGPYFAQLAVVLSLPVGLQQHAAGLLAPAPGLVSTGVQPLLFVAATLGVAMVLAFCAQSGAHILEMACGEAQKVPAIAVAAVAPKSPAQPAPTRAIRTKRIESSRPVISRIY
jgi:hypothetical protein